MIERNELEALLDTLARLNGRWSRFFPTEVAGLLKAPEDDLQAWVDQGVEIVAETRHDPITYNIARCGEHLARARMLVRTTHLVKRPRRAV